MQWQKERKEKRVLMGKKSKISIIVPIYNADMYLKKCIESLINQSFTDIEIILINDGSTDSSSYICKKYAITDKRVKYKEITNNGVSNARNVGIEFAKSEWITFVDADDWVSPDYCEKLIKYAVDDVDLVIARTVSVENGVILNDSYQGAEYTYFRKEEEKLILYRSIINDNPKVRQYPHIATCSAKLFRREIIDRYRLCYKKNLKYYEDAIFNMQVIQKCETVVVTSDILYFYRFNSLSSTQKFCSDTVIYYENAAKELLKFVDEMNLQIEDDYNQFNLKNIDTILTNYFKQKKKTLDQYKFIRNLFNLEIFKNSIARAKVKMLPSKTRIIIAICGKLGIYMPIIALYRKKSK